MACRLPPGHVARRLLPGHVACCPPPATWRVACRPATWRVVRHGCSAGQRFAAKGIPLVMVADKKPTPPAGPWWIWNYLQYSATPASLEVQSWFAFYSLSSNPYGAGNHYCKLLSPARALEHIFIDGLRR